MVDYQLWRFYSKVLVLITDKKPWLVVDRYRHSVIVDEMSKAPSIYI